MCFILLLFKLFNYFVDCLFPYFHFSALKLENDLFVDLQDQSEVTSDLELKLSYNDCKGKSNDNLFFLTGFYSKNNDQRIEP